MLLSWHDLGPMGNLGGGTGKPHLLSSPGYNGRGSMSGRPQEQWLGQDRRAVVRTSQT